MITKIVNNSRSDVQLSTGKSDNSQNSSSVFDAMMNSAAVSTDKSVSTNKNADTDVEIEVSDEAETTKTEENGVVSILLLNNSFMQLLNNNLTSSGGELSDDAINSMLAQSQLGGLSLDEVKQALEYIKLKLSGQSTQENESSFALLQNTFNQISSTTNTSVAKDDNTINTNILKEGQISENNQSNESKLTITNNVNSNGQATENIKNNNVNTESDNQAIVNPKIELTTNKQASVAVNKNISKDVLNISENASKNANEINSQQNQVAAQTVKTVVENAASEISNSQPNQSEKSNVNGQANNTQFKAEDNNVQSTVGSQESNSDNGQSINNSGNSNGQSNSNSGDLKKQTQNFEKQLDNFVINTTNNSANNVQTESSSVLNERYDERARIQLNDIPRLVNKLVSEMPSNSTQQAKLYLEPANLGKLTINITLNGNSATISFKADSKEAVQSIENQMSALKDKLSNSGIKIESAEVEQQTSYTSADSNNNNNEGGSSHKQESVIKKQYLNIIRGAALDNLTIDELPAQESKALNNASLERYI